MAQVDKANPITIQKFQENGNVITTVKKQTRLTAMMDMRIDRPVDCFNSCTTAKYSALFLSGCWKNRPIARPFPPQPDGGPY
jgi:hypothetical protein